VRPILVSALAFLACAHTVTESDQASARIHHDIALTNMNRGELREALRELLTAVELDPEMPQVHNALGLVYHGMGHLEDAIEHYQKAVELKPTYSEAHNNLGVALMSAERYDEAIAAFRVALGDILYGTPSLAEGNMGWAYYLKKEADLGKKHLRNAVATNPKFCRGYEWLAKIGLDEGNPEQVVANCKRFEKYCLDDVAIGRTIPPDYLRQMQYYLGMGYMKLGDHDAAKRALVQCAVVDADGEYGGKCAQTLRSLQ
jgi:type IV pilus assembly protein PilF